MKARAIVFVISGLGLAAMLALSWVAGGATAQAAQLEKATAVSGELITVTVKSGESLATYANRFGVSGSALLAVNDLDNADVILPGQIIVIPVIKTFTPSLTTPFYYTVQPGDTLFSIGAKFELPFDVIGAANGLADSTVTAGKTILIPAGPHVHIVAKGENLETVALRYNVTLAFMQKANPSVTNPSQLFIGQLIHIPIMYGAKPLPIPTGTPAPASTATPTPTAAGTVVAGNFITVVAQEGDSLPVYVRRYGISASAILNVNAELRLNPDDIFPGDVIVIPITVSFTPSLSTPFFYTVAPGDTALSIAAKFEVSVDTLILANPKSSFAAGATILVPAGPHVYIVKAGDTLETVASRYLVTTDALLNANPAIANIGFLFVGQKITIPTQFGAVPIPFP
ncbi:MAG: LysM peptidoglycan-binding domain-containing protein [Chloroflexi bacterium]|nr:LysM peptidoglycan-binding domain-containing protein [Chloroflexota bacterium]